MQTTGPASPEQPPALEPAEAKVEEGAQPKEEEEEEVVVVKADGEGEEGEQEEEKEKGGRGVGRPRRRRGGAVGDGAVVMVKRELLARCMTCPVCRRLLRDATTISECLHTCESSLLRRPPADPGGLERSHLSDDSARFCWTYRNGHSIRRTPRSWGCSGFGRPGPGDVGWCRRR